jgi:long-chain fatty acid transport protein
MRRALLLSVVATTAWAGGFAVSDQDAMASGRSGTGVGVSGQPSAIHFNPAGLGDVEGLAVTGGASVLVPSATAVDPATGARDSSLPGVRVPPHVYAALSTGQLVFGVGFNAPFGGGLAWPADWRGATELTQLQLQVLAGHIGLAWRFNEQWSAGGNLSVYGASVLLERRIDYVDRLGDVRLGGSGLGFGGQLGLRFAPTERVRLGLTGRLPSGVPFVGTAAFSDVPPAFWNTLPDQGITSRLVLPGRVALGGDVVLPWFRLLVDVELTFWSSFDAFVVDFSHAQTPDVRQPRNWQNAPTFRLGGEREFGKLVVRAGAVLDVAASPADTLSPSLPDSTRLGASAGAGYDFGPVRADLSYAFTAFLPRESTGEALPARYEASAHGLALSVTMRALQPAKPVDAAQPN